MALVKGTKSGVYIRLQYALMSPAGVAYTGTNALLTGFTLGAGTYQPATAITTQTSSAAVLTIPDLAGVAQQWVFTSVAQTLVNKTLTAPAWTGTMSGTSTPVITMDNATVVYTTAFSTNSLLLSATDAASAKLILGASGGTNGLDVTIQGATAAEQWVWDANLGKCTYQGLFYPATVKTATKTTGSLAITDCGYLLVVTADAQTITLPSTVVGYCYKIMNGTTGQILTISPAAIDMIMGAGLTAADDKDLINTAVTAKRGDYVVLVGDGVNGWYILDMVGTWARQA